MLKRWISLLLTVVMLLTMVPSTALAVESKPLEGKKLSVLGASISTYAGTSNGAAADTTNSTIRSNVKYYPNSTIPEVTLNDTWWMQACEDMGMELLVNNAWSGSAILLERSGTVGAYVDRCVQLHDDTGANAGEEPDIICIQMGFNDFSYGKSTLGTSDIDYDALITADGYGTPATTMEATAIMLDKMVKRYPDADIYMFNHFKRINQSAADTVLMENLNASIEEVCGRFGVTVVDLYHTLTEPEHIGDGNLHPNRLGMDVITEAVKTAILSNHPEAAMHTVSLELDGATADYGADKLVADGDSFTLQLTASAGDALKVSVTMGGEDITDACCADGTVSIDAVTADVIIAAESVHESKSYRWEFDGTDLVSVTAGGNEENTLTKNAGTTTDGVFSTTRYALETPVVLSHEKPWVVEWQSEGTWQNPSGSGGRMFTSDDVNAHYNARYIFKSSVDGLIAMGEKTTSGSHNYGIALGDYGIDWTEPHTYRLENRIAGDGANMIWLFVDGVEIGPMTQYHVGTTDKNTTSDWLCGKDFVFPYMGTDSHGFTNCSIDYIQVWEGGELTHAVPASKGVANVIKRAYQLTDVTWTPLKDMPGVMSEDGVYSYQEFEAGKTYTGIPYSGVIDTDTYVGLNVRLDSFMTALQNGNSVLYTENLFAESYPKKATYFGTVCSKFAQYALNIPGAFNTANVPNIPGMTTVAMPGQYDLNDMKLGDIIVDTSYHTALCTDILYNANGDAVQVEISEAIAPTARRLLWTSTEFAEEFANYRLCRYAYIDDVPDVESVSTETEPALMPRFGDGYNYRVSNTPGVVDILKSGYSKAVILRDGELVEEIALSESTETFAFDRSVPGKLEMYLETSGGETSESVYACVVDSSVEVTDSASFFGGELSVRYNGTSGTPLYVQVGSAQAVFCELDGETGSVVSLNPSAVSNGKIRVAYQNEYGIYLSPWSSFSIDESAGTGTNSSSDPMLSQGVYWDGWTLTPSSSKPLIQDGKEAYWTYAMVPVEGNATYYSEGANRSWYFDSNKQPISTINVYKDCNPAYQFTTPANAAYMSLSYSPDLVEQGTERMSRVTEEAALALRYDDHMDVSDRNCVIVDAGKPTSYQVGYGVGENTVRDTAVVTLKGDTLVATGIGTAQVKLDGVTYAVTVEAAPISLLLLAGQSNMRGSEGNAAQSIVCPDGMVYATYGDDRGADNVAMTASNAAQFAPSALTGAYSTINTEGTTECVSGYPVYSLTEAGAGKIGPDSGFAYEWVQQTGEKVWVVNAAHGGTSINVWQPGTTEYEQCQALFTACQETLRKEIAAGHYTLSHMAYFWCQGCSDRTQTAAWYVNKYLTMHESLKTELAFDHDSDPATAEKTFEFGGIIPVRVGSTVACYRDGVNSDANPYAYHESFVDLRMSGPRVAQYWMGNNPELEDIWNVCTIGEDWVWMPDGTNGVSDYFQKHYPNGTVDYTTQVAQTASWYTPTTPKAVHDSIHYNQIGYNEIGRESVRNALIMMGVNEDYEEETTVEFVNWTGYQPAGEIAASTTGRSGTLVVPMVSPITRCKAVTYTSTGGLRYEYYDLLADSGETAGTLTAVGANSASVNVVKQAPGALYANHLSQLPDKLCKGVNLWSVLEHDPLFYSNGTHWGTHSSGTVYSVTIPVQPGDKLYATAWGKAGDNGHATSNGIRVTFFGDYDVVKTMDPAGTYAEFSANGGYLVAPEGATAVNIPMWTNEDSNEIYILSRAHDASGELCSICGKSSHEHSWSEWQRVTLPTASAQGVEQRTCACGETEARKVDGVWQKHALAEHLSQLPENTCCGTNLWTALEHDEKYFASGVNWGVYSGGSVCSVTIPVTAGEKVYASSFGKAGENGHASSSGIRTTFFDAWGVAKTMTPAQVYAEFSANGGYLVAPEGAIAVNVAMWTNSDAWELYLPDRAHQYTNGICTGCGESLYSPEWEVGTIAAANGLNRGDKNRLRTTNYLELVHYGAVTIDPGYMLVRFIYDKDHKMLNGTDWLGSGVGFSVDALKTEYPDAVYFRIALCATDNRNLTLDDLTSSGVKFHLPGADVPSFDAGFEFENVASIGSWQDGAVWNGKLFALGSSGDGAVFDVKTGAKLGILTLEGKNVLKPHANSVCFGSTYYAEGDTYPLLYVNIYNNYANAVDRMEGTCCVYRITGTNGTFSTELVQVIRVGFTEDLMLWKSKENNGDVRPYGNFVVDTDENQLYAFVMRDANKTTRFFGFDIPASDAGIYSDLYGCNVVTLEPADINAQFDIEYFNYLQGCCYSSGMLLSVEGFGGDAPLRIVDLKEQKVVRTYYLGHGGLTKEPEVLCVDPDTGVLYYAAADGVLRNLTLDDVHFHQYAAIVTLPTCTQQGYTTYTCDCGDSYVDDYTAPTGEHNYTAGVCGWCGVSKLGSEWLVPDFAEGDYTMIAIPDTQNLVTHWPEVYYDLYRWIAENRDELNIQAVLHMGDMVNNNTAAEWTVCEAGTDILNAVGIPWMPMRGNHDDSAWFNRYYDYQTYGTDQSWFGGSYEDGKLDHTYWFVTAGEREYLMLSLGCAPSWDVLSWAQEVVEAHPEKNVILSCHAYMNQDGTLLSQGDAHCVSSYYPGYPDGDDVWAAFKDYGNVVLAMGGHIHSPDVVSYVDKNGADRDITSLLIDRQNDDVQKRLGMVAVFTFHTDSDAVEVNWLSTRYDALSGTRNQFAMEVPHVKENYSTIQDDLTAQFDSWTTGGPVLFADGYGYGERGYSSGSNANLKYSDYVAVDGYDMIRLTICARTGYCATGGFAFYADAAPSTFISAGSAARSGNGASAEGTEIRTIAVPEGAKYIRVTYWSEQSSHSAVPFSCIGYRTAEPCEHNYHAVVTEPSCTEDGYTTYTCTVCGQQYIGGKTAALGHNYEETVTEPTCTTDGYTTLTCTRCGNSERKTYVVDITDRFEWTDGKMILATTGAYTDFSVWCASDYVDISAYSALEIRTANTAIQTTTTGLAFYDADKNYINGVVHTDGSGVYGVLVHNLEVPENAVYIRTTWYSENHANYNREWGGFWCKGLVDCVPALGHDYEETVFAPTCTEQGYTTHTCTACGDSYVDVYVDATGEHTYENGICTGCSAAHPNLVNFEGKVISILSASTSTFAGYIPVADGFNLNHRARYPQENLLTDVNETWWMQLINQLDAKLGINDSWAGSQVLNTQDTNSGDLGPDAAMASLTRIQNLGANGTPDVILFFGAGNDIGRGVTPGSFDPAKAPTQVDLTTTKWSSLADAYVAAIMRLQHFYPDSQIVAMTTYAMPGYATAAKLDQYGPMIKEICQHYGVPYLDLRNAGVTFDMLPDNIHPNAEGMDHITEAVLNKLLSDAELTAGENEVYPVTHDLTNVKASRGYYKGVSAGESFSETLTGDNMTVTVTMDGKDITASCYANGKVNIPVVTGAVKITGKAAFNADGHLQQLPENVCAGTNLWTALEPENIYYTVNGWGNTSAGTTWSITFPVKAGDRIWATSLGAYPGNGSTANGVRITWFNENGLLETVSRDKVYAEFARDGYVTAPEGATALNLPMTGNSADYAVKILTREHPYTAAVTPPTCTEQGYTTHTCTVCGDSYTDDYINAAGHTAEIIPATAPSCDRTGLTEGSRCVVCGETLVEQQVIPATGPVISAALDEHNTLTVTGVIADAASSSGLIWAAVYRADGQLLKAVQPRDIIPNQVLLVIPDCGNAAVVRLFQLEQQFVPRQVSAAATVSPHISI